MHGKQFSGCGKVASAQALVRNNLVFSLENCRIISVVVFLADEVEYRPS